MKDRPSTSMQHNSRDGSDSSRTKQQQQQASSSRACSLTSSLASISLSSGTDEEPVPTFTCRLCHQDIGNARWICAFGRSLLTRSSAVPQLEAHTMSCQVMPRPACLSDFKFIRRLGSGSYGEVWLAEHKITQQVFAMKILDSQKPKFNYDRVMRERDILAQTDHRNIVKMAYSFQEKDLFFMALEFHARGNLNQMIDEFRIVHGQRGDALPESIVRKIIAEVVAALEYLHAHGIAHRDVKPENLLVADNGRMVLADFGLASVHTPIRTGNATEPQERMNHPLGCGSASDLRASSVGSPLYRAPETFAEVLRKAPLPPYSTHLTDLWSLGIMMHELLTGSFALNKLVPPNDIDDMKDLVREMRAYVNGGRPIFWPVDVTVSRHAQSLVEQLLQPNPFARPSLDLIKAHPFFHSVDWQNLDSIQPMFIPMGPSPAAPSSSSPFSMMGSLNVPAPLLRTNFGPAIYDHRALEFQYVGMAQLLAYNHWRVMQYITSTSTIHDDENTECETDSEAEDGAPLEDHHYSTEDTSVLA